MGAILASLAALSPENATAQELGESSVDELRMESAKGNPEADFQLGLRASMQRLPGESPTKAYEYLRRSADAGHLEAGFLLGSLYLKGFAGQQTSLQAAERYLRQAAERGHAGAQEKIGQYHLSNANNPSEAARWFQAAANQGLASAENNLGLLYAEGRGVNKDPARAFELINRAASKGLPGAKHNLGLLYKSGTGVAADPNRAKQLFEEAAQQGYQRSQYVLAQMHMKGEGVSQNPVETLKWLMISASGKDKKLLEASRRTLIALVQQTSPTQVHDAAEAARQWAIRYEMNAPYQVNQN
ncbi:tetratricopeptide repeat protein [Fodinicurvata halophila]